MSRLSIERAALLAGAVAVLVFVNALGNGWAMDDVGVIQQNPAAHSLSAAWQARFSPYWPVVGEGTAGQYRPVTILSYAVDWVLSGGRPGWFHAVNVLWHGLVTVLVVLVLGAWLRPLGALVAGLVFATHPVHVEAVANVVGRAELLAAAGLLGAVLCARRYRHGSGRARAAWLAATLGAVAFAVGSKEHAAVAIVVLGLDHALDSRRARDDAAELYLAVAALTLAWLMAWRSVAGLYVGFSEAATLRGLSAAGRWATMLPTHLDVLRLLTLPLDLAHDYNPQVIPRRTEFTALAFMGLTVSGAMVALALASVRRAPAFAFAVLAGAAAFAPTSNLLFASGVVFAERTLYLAVLAPAAAAAVVAQAVARRATARAWLVGGLVLLTIYVGRTLTRTPFWRDNPTVVVEGVIQHPESYRIHVQVGSALERTGDSAAGLAEYLLAGALFPEDPFVPMRSAPLALALGRTSLALSEAHRAQELVPSHTAVARLVVEMHQAAGERDSALAHARAGVERAPRSRVAATTYRDLVANLEAPEWQRLMADARLAWLSLDLARATDLLLEAGDAVARAGRLDGLCWELQNLLPAVRTLVPRLESDAAARMAESRRRCELPGDE